MAHTNALCSCKPYAQRNVDIQSEPYESSYKRSYFYKNIVDQPLVHIRVKRRARDDLKVQDPILLTTRESVTKTTFVQKFSEDCSSTDFFRRSSLLSRDNLKSLHEKYITEPPKPKKIVSTTTGTVYVVPEKFIEPKTWRYASPVEQFTCSIPSNFREALSSFSPNECAYTKHLDPYVTTSQLTHCAFDREQQNGVARKNITTFYDALNLPKNHGFGPKRQEPFGSYFHHDRVNLSRVCPRSTRSVPFFGKSTTYEAHYHFVPTNLMHREESIDDYPAIGKSIEEPSYCTEQCHIGTGWPVRGSVNIGTVRGTF